MEKEQREVVNVGKNLAIVEGMIVFPFTESTISDKQGFYETYIDIRRSSGTVDRIRLAVPEHAVDLSRDYTGERVSVKGRFQSCSQECGGKRRLLLFISAEEIKPAGSDTDKDDENCIILEGFACKPPGIQESAAREKDHGRNAGSK